MATTPETIAIALGQEAPSAGSVLDRQWQTWIDDALMLIEVRAEGQGKDLTDLDQNRLDYVVREAVVAQVKRPDDATQVTISIDDASSSKTYKSGKGRVTILDEWWELLGLTKPAGVFAIDTAPAGRSAHVPWCDLMLGGDRCSCGVSIAGWPIFEGGEFA